jgi:uncharacterized protein (DUF111 family)
MKIARMQDGAVSNASPEYEDCRAIAAQHALPLKQVMQEAMRVYHENHKEVVLAGSSAIPAASAKDGQQ